MACARERGPARAGAILTTKLRLIGPTAVISAAPPIAVESSDSGSSCGPAVLPALAADAREEMRLCSSARVSCSISSSSVCG